jgi:phosphoribosylamine---glycine ligase
LMKVLIIGGGGREHALAWKVAQESRVSQVFVAPGNAGTVAERKVVNIDITAEDVHALADFAESNRIDLTIVGPEVPLVLGLVDEFERRGLKCFGPRAAAARLEGSKAFAKDFLRRHRIPTASYKIFTRETFDPEYVHRQRAPIVVKASGLAAGKGVVIAESIDAAIATSLSMFGGQFGPAGDEVVIEEYLQGEEASFIVMADGKNVLPLATSQDHKRLKDGDEGPNTGGMGAYSPAPVVTPQLHDRIMNEVISPSIRGLAADGVPYTGFLYAGIMVAADGTPNVLEFNCRFGDPETQPILLRLQSDLTLLCEAALAGRLDSVTAQWDNRTALGVVMAAAGYPESVRKGDVIEGLERAAQLPGKVFHAGTQLAAGKVITNGGRVLCAVGLGDSVGDAHRATYALVDSINWTGVQYRRDIGHRAISRESGG